MPALGQEAGTLTEDHLKPFEFTFIGPSNMSGRITAVDVDESSGNKTIFAALASGGIWKTTNMGTTWSAVFNDEWVAAVADVKVSRSDPDVVWAGTGERNSLRSNAWGNGVYKSTNGGRSWTNMGLEETREIGEIAIHPEDPDVVYVAALGHLWGPNPERGIFKTTDGGDTWNRVLFVNDTTGFVNLKMDPENPDILYAAAWHRLRWGGGRMTGAGEGSGIWRTMDGGATWTELTDATLDNGLPTEAMGRIGLGIVRNHPETLYAVIQVSRSNRNQSVSPHGGVFRSDDRGETWTRTHDISAVPDYFYNEVWPDPSDPETLYLGQTVIQKSTDGGQTFESERYRAVHVDNHALWINPADSDHMILGNDGGLYMTWDGGRNWDHQIIPASQFYEVDVDTTKVPYHVCGGMQDNGTWCGPSRTRDRMGITEADWYAIWGGDGFVSAVSPDDPNIRYAESQYGSTWRFNAETMERFSLQPEAEDAGAEAGYPFRWDWDTPFVVSKHDPTVVYLGGNHLFKLTDRGEDWTILGPDMTRGNRFAPEPDSGHTSYRSLHSIAESPLDAGIIWTGSNDGMVWVTMDGGATWEEVTENLPNQTPSRCWVGEIEASAHDPMTAFVAYDCHRRDDYAPYVFKTSDGGSSWTEITGDLPGDMGSYVIREDPVNPDLLFVGTEHGLYVSNVGGNRWVRMKNDLPTAAIRDMEMVLRTGELVVATYGRSVYILDIGPLREMTPETLAAGTHLFAVKDTRQYGMTNTYGSVGAKFFSTPNPPYGAAFTYMLAEDQGDEVTLSVKRVGEEETVARVQGPGSAGVHRVQWNLRMDRAPTRRLGDPAGGGGFGGGGGPDVEPGDYEVSLRVGDQTFSQTFTVIEGWEWKTPGRIR
jgi:photosystem II stability/assembly factor-like uncharacterized protein